MKNAIRCCISCILPCGSLDVVRIVHANGRVEEISGSVTAEEIMKAHPKHVLKKPSSSSSSSSAEMEEGICPKIVIVPPDAELQRGKIYFLIPAPENSHNKSSTKRASRSSNSSRRKKRETADHHRHRNSGNNNVNSTSFMVSDRYLSEILSEKVSTQRDRRRGRTGIWRPHLESISETPGEAC